MKGLFAFEAEPFEFEAYGGSESEFTFRAEPFPWPPESEWEGEANRSSPDYIRWVQSSLNRVMGLRLAVDGIVGPVTRSAVRSFQQRKGLAVDGIVGPKTEAALVAAGAPRPPASISATATGGGSPSNIPPQCSAGAAGSTCVVLEEFDQDEDALTADHEKLVQNIAERLIYNWETNSLLIRGHASIEGPEVYNYDLAKRRAEEVEFALVAKMESILPGSTRWIDLQPYSCGETTPIPGISDLKRQRRVDVCFLPPKGWFETGGTGANAMQPVRAGNDVQYYIGGRQTFGVPPLEDRGVFKEMVRAIRTAKTSSHYIYLLGWWLTMDFELIERNVMTTVHALFRNANAKHVQIRAMLWDQWKPASQNEQEVQEINGLRFGAAIHDNRVLASERTLDHKIGSHHQKILIVKGEEGLIGFCGGSDINPDRIRATGDTQGAPFHDVDCRIKGPAAHDLLKIFLERWQDHPDSAKPAAKPEVPLLGWGDYPGKQTVPLPPYGKVYVQIGRTYGNGNPTTGHIGVDGGYSFAPDGERTALRMILKAIAEAKKFIYIEDQYLVSMEISDALMLALQKPQNLIVIILIPHASVTFLGFQTQFRRQQFITPLRQFPGSRVGVFFLGGTSKCCDPAIPPPKCVPGTGQGSYVHSKMMVVDDEYAIIGSANLGRRSLTHDSEAIAGIYDPSPDSLVKRLRVDLWAKHLRIKPSALADGVASANDWFAGAGGICVYHENLDVEPNHTQLVWNETDPDGS